MFQSLRHYIYLSLLLVVVAMVWACGDGSSSSSATTQSYAGPGSQWTSAISSDGTFTLNESESSLILSGTWTETDGGFKKLIVTSSSDTGSVALGSTAFALDIPGVVLLLKPLDGTQMITMVKSGECPQTDVTSNWIMTNSNTDMGADILGTFAYTAATTSATLPARYQLDGTDIGASALGSFSCSSGTATISDARMYLTQNGSAIVHSGTDTAADETDDAFIMALPASQISSLSNLDGNYRGLVFADNTGADELFPVAITLNNGTGTGNEIDADTGVTSDPVSVNFTSVDSPSDGFINGTIGGSTVRCMANTDVNASGKNFVFCIGENPGETGKLYNLLMINS